MASRATEEQISACQRDIQRWIEGASHRLFVVIVVDMVAFLSASAWSLGAPPAIASWNAPAMTGLVATALGTLLYFVGDPLLCRVRLRRTIGRFSPAQQAQVLLPLRALIAADAVDIVEPLIRALKLTEVLPAEPCEGRGDEAAPVSAMSSPDVRKSPGDGRTSSAVRQ